MNDFEGRAHEREVWEGEEVGGVGAADEEGERGLGGGVYACGGVVNCDTEKFKGRGERERRVRKESPGGRGLEGKGGGEMENSKKWDDSERRADYG